MLRFASAAVAFALLALALERTLRMTGRSDRLHLAAATVLLTLNQLAFIYGLHFTTAITIALVGGLIPILIVLFSAAMGIDRLTVRVIVASAVSFAGVALIVAGIPGGVSGLSGEFWGVVFAVATPVTFAAFSVAAAPPMARYSPYRINALSLLGTAAALLLVGSPTLPDQDYASPGTLAWLSLAFSAFGGLVLANVLWFGAIDRVGPSRASIFVNIQPFAAAVFAAILLAEELALVQVAGGVLIAVGIAISPRHPSPVPLEE